MAAVASQFRSASGTLIPGLPNDLGALILAFVPYSYQSRLKPVCRSWRRFFSSKKSLNCLRQVYEITSQLLCIFPQDPSISSPYLFDPKHLSWRRLPPMPCNPHVYGLCNFVSVSVGPHLYVLGGSLFDTRSFPLDRPSPTSAAFRFDFATWSWDSLPPMITPRGSFACAPSPDRGRILLAGGGSRHAVFGAGGSRTSSAEMYDISRGEWVGLDGLPRFRAGCVGFVLGREFWVMGGYGESRTVSGVFPVDEYYRDAAVMELDNGCRWREIGDMWEEGERRKLGRIAIVEDGGGAFMLDRGQIFRYDMVSNRWRKETCLPRRRSPEGDASSVVGFVGMEGELHVLELVPDCDSRQTRNHPNNNNNKILMQMYDPKRKMWRQVTAKPPFSQSLDFKTAVMCTIRL